MLRIHTGLAPGRGRSRGGGGIPRVYLEEPEALITRSVYVTLETKPWPLDQISAFSYPGEIPTQLLTVAAGCWRKVYVYIIYVYISRESPVAWLLQSKNVYVLCYSPTHTGWWQNAKLCVTKVMRGLGQVWPSEILWSIHTCCVDNNCHR